MVKNKLYFDESQHNVKHVFDYISREFVTVDKGKRKTANKDLRIILHTIQTALKDVSPLFKAMFETCLFCGSSFDGLKVGKPNEFDIDLKLYLPDRLDVQIIQSDKPGFVHVYLKNWHKVKKDNRMYREMEKEFDIKDTDTFLSQAKMKQWMESIVAKAMNKIQRDGTLDSIKLHYLVVPKPPKAKDCELNEDPDRYWRLSFPEQEMEFMNDLQWCKPAIRFLKKLRDTQNHNIPSYFIKTVFLWEVDKRNKSKDHLFWRKPLPTVILEMLKIYKRSIEEHEILYFWSDKNNLLQSHSDINMSNIADFLQGMIETIERTKNPFVFAKYLLPPAEYEKMCNDEEFIAKMR